jgi:hypothetical protein
MYLLLLFSGVLYKLLNAFIRVIIPAHPVHVVRTVQGVHPHVRKLCFQFSSILIGLTRWSIGQDIFQNEADFVSLHDISGADLD